MKTENEKQLDALMRETDCPHEFRCARKGFKDLCKARDAGIPGYLDCLEDRPADCPFALSFGDGFMCQCKVRVFLARHADD
jgi:hypothetical protein